MNKFNAGKASVWALVTTLLFSGILMVNSFSNTFAKDKDKVFVCHRDEGKSEWKVKEIDESALDTHLGHGDFLYGGDAEDPKKDDEWCADNAESDGDGEGGTPTPTPTEAPFVSPSCTGDQHLDAAGRNCVSFGVPGPGDPGTGSSASTGTGGQVLGASTMAGTGSFADTLNLAIMIIGGLFTFQGAKGFKKAFKNA